MDVDGTTIPVGGTGPGGYNYVGPRGRVGRENAANGVQPVTYSRPRRESRRESQREKVVARPRYSSAAAVAAAVVQGDGYKPREERGWEEFHQDLDVEAKFAVYSAEEVDGTALIVTRGRGDACRDLTFSGANIIPKLNLHNNGERSPGQAHDANIEKSPSTGMDTYAHAETAENAKSTPLKRRPGRPPRRQGSMLNGIGTPDIPKIIPLPGPNPRERLTLPKPSFRLVDPFVSYEHKAIGLLNYVDRTMANVGYQESDLFLRPEKRLIRVAEGSVEEDLDIGPVSKNDGDTNAAIGGVGVGRVEYDMDEQDNKWLEAYNLQRKAEQVEAIKPAIFEITMTKIEKEWHALEKRIPKPNPKPPQTHRPRSSSAAAVNGEPAAAGEEQDSKCAICDDGDCENTNAIVFCDGCDLAVHQECYGVPFIPEGQWLCRKCQLIGRGTPTCIFCPNVDGAFKQTNTSRWSHLLCAIWIPEVTLGNTTFMEPVMDVEKVPKQRWKLTCYICRQKMGACIQCGNKNCFVAFHVTCARRARLFLKMKSNHGGPASLDGSALKAYCDKHVPSDWRRENGVEAATAEAMEYYHYTMRGRLWADSQQSALAIVSAHSHAPSETVEEDTQAHISITVGGNKRKRVQAPKTLWRLPSGAPVIPQAVYNSVESSLQRFNIRKRKDYTAEACKYWTLKREARRGAALLKRLQLQMETFSSMEITRRNFVGMGAAGKVRLQRRIDFAIGLQQDVERLRILCDEVRKREQEKLKDVSMLKDIIDIVYFPIAALLWPILEKAQALVQFLPIFRRVITLTAAFRLDGKGIFQEGFSKIRSKLEKRFYTSVSTFSADFGTVFSSAIGLSGIAPAANLETQIHGTVLAKDLSSEQKDKRKLAKRIVKAVQYALEDATRKESELCRKPFEKELKELDLLLENSVLSRRDSLVGSLGDDRSDDEGGEPHPLTKDPQSAIEIANMDGLDGNKLTEGLEAAAMASYDGGAASPADPQSAALQLQAAELEMGTSSGLDLQDAAHRERKGSISDNTTTESSTHHGGNRSAELSNDHVSLVNGVGDAVSNGKDQESEANLGGLPTKVAGIHPVPPTPPLSSEGDSSAPLSHGGIPWYMDPFDPIGTTIHEERWTGRDVVRGMSEELSDMDDEELQGLVDEEMTDAAQEGAENSITAGSTNATLPARRKAVGKRRRWRGFR